MTTLTIDADFGFDNLPDNHERIAELRLVDPDAAAVGNRWGGLLRGPARWDVEFTPVTA